MKARVSSLFDSSNVSLPTAPSCVLDVFLLPSPLPLSLLDGPLSAHCPSAHSAVQRCARNISSALLESFLHSFVPSSFSISSHNRPFLSSIVTPQVKNMYRANLRVEQM